MLAALAEQRVVTVYDGGEEPVYAIERGQHLVAAFYRNSAIHHVVDRAIAELVLLRDPADRWDEAMRLRDLLKFEFFFPERDAYRQQIAAELERLDPDWETADGRDVLCRAPLLVAHRVLRSFVDAQLVVAERLAARDPRTPVVEAEFLDECGGVGAADAAAGPPARPGVAVARAVRQRRCGWRPTSTWSTPGARSWAGAGRTGPRRSGTSSRGWP